MDIYLGVEKRKSENAECKKCKQIDQGYVPNLLSALEIYNLRHM